MKELAIQKLYPERAEIFLTADQAQLRHGQALKLDVRITQKSAFPISPGELEVLIDRSKLLPVPGHELRHSIGEIAGVVPIGAQKPMLLTLAGNATGESTVKARLTTKHARPPAPNPADGLYVR